MRGLDKRLLALEATAPKANWDSVLALLTDEELLRLEQIVTRSEAGEAIEDMNEDDQRFVASVLIGRSEPA